MKKLSRREQIKKLKKMRDLSLAARRQRSSFTQNQAQQQKIKKKRPTIIILYER